MLAKFELYLRDMEKIVKVNTVSDYNKLIGVDTHNPLASLINFEKILPFSYSKKYLGIYAIFLKDIKCGDITYGCLPYDYEEGSLIFISPRQVYGIDSNNILRKPTGYALVFHPDLLKGTHLSTTIKDYTFLTYQVREALHLSKKERKTIVSCLEKIEEEIEHPIDDHSKTLIVSNIELLLNYCMRYYQRQFNTRKNDNMDLLLRFEKLLDSYISSGLAFELGFPSVTYCAQQLGLSANYFGDLIKKETGNTALDYIHTKVIDEAKIKISANRLSIHEISLDLGFKYPQHFTRLFKSKTGITPQQYKTKICCTP